MHNPKEDNVQIMNAHEHGDFHLMLSIPKNTQTKNHFPSTFVHLQNSHRKCLDSLSNTMVFPFLIINNTVKKLTSNLEKVNLLKSFIYFKDVLNSVQIFKLQRGSCSSCLCVAKLFMRSKIGIIPN